MKTKFKVSYAAKPGEREQQYVKPGFNGFDKNCQMISKEMCDYIGRVLDNKDEPNHLDKCIHDNNWY